MAPRSYLAVMLLCVAGIVGSFASGIDIVAYGLFGFVVFISLSQLANSGK